MSGISTSEDRRKERTRAPPNFLRRGHRWPSLWNNSLNRLKAGMGRGTRASPIVWEGGGGTGDPAYVRHLWIYNMPARIGGRRGHVPLPTFEKGGGAQMALPVSDISEWIQIEGQGRRGHMLLLTLIKGHRSVCIPDLGEFKFNNIIHWHFIEV